MKNLLKKNRRIVLFCLDICIFIVSIYGTLIYLDRSPDKVIFYYFSIFFIVRIALMFFTGVYGALLKFFSIHNVISTFISIFAGSLCFAVIVLLMGYSDRMGGVGRAFVAMEFFFAISGVLGLRIVAKTYLERRWRKRKENEKILIFGANSYGESLLNQLKEQGYKVIGFLDDDINKQNSNIHDVKVLGNLKSLPKIVEKEEISLLIIAVDELSEKKIKQIFDSSRKLNIKVRIMRDTESLFDTATSDGIENLEWDNHLHTQIILNNISDFKDLIQKSNLLVVNPDSPTGHEIINQITPFKPKEIFLWDKKRECLDDFQEKFASNDTAINLLSDDIANEDYFNYAIEKHSPSMVLYLAPNDKGSENENSVNKIASYLNNILSVLNACEKNRIANFILCVGDEKQYSSAQKTLLQIAELVIKNFPSKNIRVYKINPFAQQNNSLIENQENIDMMGM